MTGWLAVALGGAIGATLRYGVLLVFARPGSGALPWHTLGVNIAGSFLLGLLMALLPPTHAAERWQLFVGVGVLGGFTTFSTFSLETVSLVQQGAAMTAAVYVVASLAGGLAGAWAGYALGRAL
jgi:CrcB protein